MATATSIKIERSARLVTPKGRASYPHVFKPSAFQGEGEPKFSVVLMVPKKGSEDFIKSLKAAREQAAKALYPTKRPTNFEVWGITDGDEAVNKDGDPDEIAAGHWLIKVSNKNRPAVIDKDSTPILDEVEVYGGCYVRLNINAKAYGTPAKGGVALELNVVQKVADGQPFGGAAAATKAAVGEMGSYEDEDAEVF